LKHKLKLILVYNQLVNKFLVTPDSRLKAIALITNPREKVKNGITGLLE